jgi:hypothetical protein
VLTYKKIDLGLQLLLAIATLFLLYQNSTKDWSNIAATPLIKRVDFSYFFFGLGAIQVISAIIHYFSIRPSRKSRFRRSYHIGAILVIALLLLIFFLPPLLPNADMLDFGIVTGVIVLVISSSLAIFYMIICWNEIKSGKNRL